MPIWTQYQYQKLEVNERHMRCKKHFYRTGGVLASNKNKYTMYCSDNRYTHSVYSIFYWNYWIAPITITILHHSMPCNHHQNIRTSVTGSYDVSFIFFALRPFALSFVLIFHDATIALIKALQVMYMYAMHAPAPALYCILFGGWLVMSVSRGESN